MTLLIAVLSRVAISFGNPRGPKNPAHSVKSKLAIPVHLGDRRHVWRCRRALRRRHRQHLDPAALHQRHSARVSGKIKIDLAAGYVVQGRTGAFVRHVDQLAVEFELQQFAGKMTGCADTRGGECERLSRAQGHHPFRRGRERRLGRHHQRQRHDSGERDRLQILSGIVADVFHEIRIDGDLGRLPDRQCVAVGGGVDDVAGADGAAGARPVFDGNRLAELDG